MEGASMGTSRHCPPAGNQQATLAYICWSQLPPFHRVPECTGQVAATHLPLGMPSFFAVVLS